MRGLQEAGQPTPLLAHLPSSAVGRAPHTATRCRLSSCSQGSRGQQDPTPQEGRPGPKAGHGRTPAHPGPGQTGSKADKRLGGRAARPPTLPTFQSGGQVPQAGLEDPPRVLVKCSSRRGKGKPSKLQGPTGVEAREGAEDRAATAQKRAQGRRSGAQMGAPCRDKGQLLMQGQLRWGLSIWQAPQCVEHLTKKGWLELTPAAPRPRPQECQKVAELPKREAPGLLGAGREQAQRAQDSAWADAASAPGQAWAQGPPHAPQGRGSHPHHLTRDVPGRGVPRAICSGRPGGAGPQGRHQRPRAGKEDGILALVPP